VELHNIFIDFKQASDKVTRPKMYESLKLLKIPTKLIRLVKNNTEKLKSSGRRTYIRGEQKYLTLIMA
jgi:hypothetical protein